MSDIEKSALDLEVYVSAETKLAIPDRVEFKSQATQYLSDGQKTILITRANFESIQNRKLLWIEFKDEIKDGTYLIGASDSPFFKIQYTEYSSVSGLTHGIDYPAISGSVTATVTKKVNHLSYNFTLDLTVKNKYDEKLTLKGHSNSKVIVYSL
ncbi:hypothetical protein [Pseudomonas sp. GL-B-19]|uniref:hypothetical protein n=1 Tax=Pseudomonas sp. GL-B-19 TaxID=2832393 RepID=UPI001CBDCBD9|nr:hypothetical protein [Pseudomonas sp. GL-B-19]